MAARRAAHKDLRKFLRAIERAGGVVTGGSRGRHWKVAVDGVIVATISGTSSDRRAHHNAVSDLRRAGLVVEYRS